MNDLDLLKKAEKALAKVRAKGDEKGIYVLISLEGGGKYFQPIAEIHDAIDGELCDLEIGTKLTLEVVELTRREYESLEEFTGH